MTKCPHCGYDLKDECLAKNVIYDRIKFKDDGEGGVEHAEYIEQGECDPFPDLVCPECFNDLNERPKLV